MPSNSTMIDIYCFGALGYCIAAVFALPRAGLLEQAMAYVTHGVGQSFFWPIHLFLWVFG